MANDDNNNSGNGSAALWYFWRTFGAKPNAAPPPPPQAPRPFVIPPSATTDGPPTKNQPSFTPLTQREIDAMEAARQERLMRKAAHYPARHLTLVGVSAFAAVLLTVNNGWMQIADKIPLLNNTVKSSLHPTVAKIESAREISFAPDDQAYSVLSKKACVYEVMNNNSKTDICFDQGHKVRGAPVQPNTPGMQPEWLAIQPRDGNKILGLAYMRLYDLEQTAEPASTAASRPTAGAAAGVNRQLNR